MWSKGRATPRARICPAMHTSRTRVRRGVRGETAHVGERAHVPVLRAYFQPVDFLVNRAGIAGLASGAVSGSPEAEAISRSSSSSFGNPAS